MNDLHIAGIGYGPGLSCRDAGFREVSYLTYTTGGLPYLKTARIGMPAIPNQYQECVTYLYADRDCAESGHESGGTGFIVGVPSTTRRDVSHLYCVTNYHVAIRDGASVIRVNNKDGGVSIFEKDSADWEFLRNGGDVAAVPIQLNSEIHQFRFIGTDGFLTESNYNAGFIGVGEDVFMVGRFVDHDGVQTNKPAIRFGNISVSPSYIPDFSNSDRSVQYFCLDMHSRTGFSGSPVVAYRTVGSDLSEAGAAGIKIHPPIITLLGIHCGQFPEKLVLEQKSGNKSNLTGPSAMTCALPSWGILKLLACDKFSKMRAALDTEWGKRNYPCPE